MYTFPFVVRSIRNVSSKIMFEVIEDSKRFSLEGIEDLVDDEDEKVYAGDVEISCKANKKEIYEDETSLVECDVKNIGNIYLEDLNVCLDKDCKKMGLGITQKEEVSFEFKPKEVGVQEVVIKASNKEVSKSTFVDVTVYDKPVIEISEMEYPEEVMYKNVYEVSFVLNKKSRFAPNDVKIIIEPINKEFELEELKESRRFILNMQGSELDSGDNWFKISISYKDKKDKSYETAKEFNIRLVNVSMVQHVRIFVRNIAESIVRVFR
ncbi:MAG: hypothetical protein U9O94_05570 [Nanoarchaeota archaeon]|nr:hypothetical protein [Nanoarchaeota archaeon]